MVSDQSGKENIITKAKELGITLDKKDAARRPSLHRVKQLESQGFQYDNAEASFELLLHSAGRNIRLPLNWSTLWWWWKAGGGLRRVKKDQMLSEAVVKVKVNDEMIHTAAEGDGPVNALDLPCVKLCCSFTRSLPGSNSIDYKVRILEESTGTEAQVRVVIESSDGDNEWHTVGGSTNLIEATWLALADALEWWLLKNRGKRK